ncbi:putative transcription factor C2C2-CO-like family [Rosa chinensis]|uniref:Putative transcription factor C2C2-CO-like family n=1 Tax=Rosa chinensis TaxID=74649 RepID=A0A2P6R081_ROSCH|nr:putative transcription factor C2C2-CO-like family [Rosa chinensis]
MDVSVVPDGNMLTELLDPYPKSIGDQLTHPTVQISSAGREARVLRYREKRKKRKFEKTIR